MKKKILRLHILIFFEAFEAYNSLDDPLAVQALEYMLLTKIMVGAPEDVQSIIQGKLALKYAGPQIEAMKAVADAYKNRSLKAFEDANTIYKHEIERDGLVKSHLHELYETLLEQNLCRIIEPFSCIEIIHAAALIGLSVETVEKKLSQMILDKKFQGILDQGAGRLIVFDDPPADKIYPTSLETMQSMGKVVDSLYDKLNLLRH